MRLGCVAVIPIAPSSVLVAWDLIVAMHQFNATVKVAVGLESGKIHEWVCRACSRACWSWSVCRRRRALCLERGQLVVARKAGCGPGHCAALISHSDQSLTAMLFSCPCGLTSAHGLHGHAAAGHVRKNHAWPSSCLCSPTTRAHWARAMHIMAAQPWIFTEIHVPRVPFGCPCRTASSPWERWSAWEAV